MRTNQNLGANSRHGVLTAVTVLQKEQILWLQGLLVEGLFLVFLSSLTAHMNTLAWSVMRTGVGKGS